MKSEKLLWNVAKEGFPVQAMAVSRDGTLRGVYPARMDTPAFWIWLPIGRFFRPGQPRSGPVPLEFHRMARLCIPRDCWEANGGPTGASVRMELPGGKPVALPGEMERPQRVCHFG